MATPRKRAAVACGLGVTGKRVRRALPPVATPPALREALRRTLLNRPAAAPAREPNR
jgi:hypothetical protein